MLKSKPKVVLDVHTTLTLNLEECEILNHLTSWKLIDFFFDKCSSSIEKERMLKVLSEIHDVTGRTISVAKEMTKRVNSNEVPSR